MRSPEPRDLVLPPVIPLATRQPPRRPDRATKSHHPGNHTPPSGRKHLSHGNTTPVNLFPSRPDIITARCARRTPPAQRVQTEKSKIKTAFPTHQPIFTHARCARRAPRAQHPSSIWRTIMRPHHVPFQPCILPHSSFPCDSPKFPRIERARFSPAKPRPSSHPGAPAQNKPNDC